MSCLACSRRLLGAFVEAAGGHPISLRPQPRRLPSNALMQTRSRLFSTRPALRFTESLRFPDLKHTDGLEDNRPDTVTPSNLNPEPRNEPTRAGAVAEEGTNSLSGNEDPDPAELREEVGLASEEPDVQSRLWELTGGLSGTRPPKVKAAKKKAGEGKENEALARKITKLTAKGGVENPAKKDKTKKKAPWMVQKEALKEKFGEEGWKPRKRLSPDAMEGIRRLHASDPQTYTTSVLADEFKVSPEVVRRILKSNWRPSEEEQEERAQRWEKRGEKIWESQVEKGIKPPKKWRVKGVGSVKGGRDVVPKWKRKHGGRKQGANERVPFKEFTRPRGRDADYGDEGGWNDRIL
ncbi:Required for respiratory growth protein 9 mitochondrial [Botryosphaeria dothidea]